MVKATPLLVIALGLGVAYRSNVWNIGAEGQFVMGAVAASGVALLAEKTTGGWIVVPVVIAGIAEGVAANADHASPVGKTWNIRPHL